MQSELHTIIIESSMPHKNLFKTVFQLSPLIYPSARSQVFDSNEIFEVLLKKQTAIILSSGPVGGQKGSVEDCV
jgi:hypothetical protein